MSPSAEPVRGAPSVGARTRAALVVLALVALALALRWTGIGFQLPHSWEPDGLVLERQVELLERGDRDAVEDPFFAFYPHLVARLVTLTPKPPPGVATTLDEHLAEAARERVRIRRAIAAISVLAVPIAYLLAREFLGIAPSLFAAAMTAFGLLWTWFAQQTRPHAATAVFAALGVLVALRLRRAPTAAAYVAATAATVLAVCSLQSGVAVLFPLLAAHVLRAPGGTRHSTWLLVGGAVTLGAAIRLYYPFSFVPDEAVLPAADVPGVGLSGHRIELAAFDGSGFSIVLQSLWSYEPVLTLLAAVGALVAGAGWIARRAQRTRAPGAGGAAGWRSWFAGRESLAVVLAYVVPYALVLGAYANTYQRFVIPLLPFLAVLAAWGLFATCSYAYGRRGHWLAAGIGVAACGFQALAVRGLVQARARPDTSAEAAAWITRHLDPARERIALGPLVDLPLWRTGESRGAQPVDLDTLLPWVRHQRTARNPPPQAWDLRRIATGRPEARAELLADPAGYVRVRGATYAVIDVFSDPIRQYQGLVRTGVARGGRRVARFAPQSPDRGDDRPLGFQDDHFEWRPSWFARALRARTTGPVLEIWQL